MQRQWRLIDSFDPQTVKDFSLELSSPEILAKILLNRGIEDVESARRFFLPRLSHLYDPFAMSGMSDAVRRIRTALERKERILVYGDYDVDGITATSMLMLFFRGLGHPVDFYIPDRMTEGYGLSERGVRAAHARGVSLIITVDCGVTAIEEVGLARTLGIDVIVCDHHQPGPELPPAHAVLNPKKPDCAYPFKELAGVGVGFKLIQALQQALDLEESRILTYLDLVAIGSAADIVPLVDENRILVKHGLKHLVRSEKLGLQALLNVVGLTNQELGTGHLVFIVAPRINAVGRLGDAGRAVRLLTADNPQQANNIAAILDSENKERRSIDEEMFAEAIELVETQFDLAADYALVLDKPGWHPGVIGIVASRIVEKYYRPTIMIATDDGMGKGSARSIGGFDIYEALKECRDLMVAFGGHKYAAGLTIRAENIPRFRERFNQVAAARLNEELLTPKLTIDGELRFREINADFLKLLRKLAPFGPQNMRPVFCSRDLQVVGSPSTFGNDNHLRFKVRQDGVVMEAVGFNLGDLKYRLAPGEGGVELAYVLDENEWQGRKFLQLRVKDLR